MAYYWQTEDNKVKTIDGQTWADIVDAIDNVIDAKSAKIHSDKFALTEYDFKLIEVINELARIIKEV